MEKQSSPTITLTSDQANIVSQMIQKGFLRGIFSAEEACIICPVFLALTQGENVKAANHKPDEEKVSSDDKRPVKVLEKKHL